MKRIRHIAKMELLHIKNDHLSIKLMIFPVIIQLFVLGYAITNIVKHTPIAWCDFSATTLSRSMLANFEHTELFDVKEPSSDSRSLKQRIDRGNIKIGIIIPSDFSYRCHQKLQPTVTMLIDGQDANSSMVAQSYARALFNRWYGDFQRNQLKKLPPIQSTIITTPVIQSSILFNPQLESTWFMVPALAVMLVTMVTGLLAGLSIVKERVSGTLEQLMVTPLSPAELIMGKTAPYIMIGCCELALSLGTASLWFGIPFRGNLVSFLLFGGLYLFSALGIGIFASTIAKTPQQVLFIIWFILIFFLLLSGFFIPIENMPLWLQKGTLINPMRHFVFVVREIFLKGTSINDLHRELTFLATIGTIFYGGAILLFRRKLS